VKNSIQKVMQTYGNFLKREKTRIRIVDKWKKRKGENYLNIFTKKYSGLALRIKEDRGIFSRVLPTLTMVFSGSSF
jgi:hypothetical protein